MQMMQNITNDKAEEMQEDREKRFCVVGRDLKTNLEVMKATEHFKLSVVFSEDGSEYINDNQLKTIFVLDDFEDEVYNFLHKSGCTIVGPPVLIQSAKQNIELPKSARPLYTTIMKNLVICFSGFRSKEIMNKMATLVHHMGGCVKKEFSAKVTHIIANSTLGEKYRYAVSFGTPIMKEQWLYEIWSRRRDLNYSINNDENLIKLKLQPFHGCIMTFFGFKNDEKLHMEELAVQNGGKICKVVDDSCTHLVIEERAEITENLFSNLNSKTHLVTSEWFWASIQMDACADETIYRFQQQEQMDYQIILSPSTVHNHKRKRQREIAHCLSIDTISDKESSSHPSKLQNIEGNNSTINSSTFDDIFSPDGSFSIGSPIENSHLSPLKPVVDLKLMTARQQVCTELLQTETNYVGILKTIVMLFKEPLEQPDQTGGPLLDGTEIKIIFGNIPPIYEVHTKLREDLYFLLQNWKEEKSVGNIILKHSNDFLKAYPPFVNYFEKTKEVLVHCDQTKPRFHAFLKRCQSKPECGRQSLVELMIRPIQRLPSMILLLNDILKHTHKSNSDHEALQKAVLSLKEVANHINENKRKTESQVAMFDIINDIENCPAHLLSSHRSFIMELEMQEMGCSINDKGDIITMFLFTDMLEICKRRTKTSNTIKSPGTVSNNKTVFKAFKHLELLHLSHIKRVIDVKETEECKNVFALVVRTNDELKERLCKFILLGDETNKNNFLYVLCRSIANVHCRADSENLLVKLGPEQLAIDINETSNTFSKAMKLASRTKSKLGRALSMKKTPTKRGLSRAMSTIISPLRLMKSPTSTLQCLNLPSTTNLSDPSIFSNFSENRVPKLNTKIKSSSLGPSSSKYI